MCKKRLDLLCFLIKVKLVISLAIINIKIANENNWPQRVQSIKVEQCIVFMQKHRIICRYN